MSILAAEPMTIAEKQHRTIRWATRVLTCGSTIILHTKSVTRTAGLCEIAAVDTDGGVLLNTLVNPGATLGGLWNTLDPHLHFDALTEAPTPANAVQLLVDITTTSRHVLAYNAGHPDSFQPLDGQHEALTLLLRHLVDSAEHRRTGVASSVVGCAGYPLSRRHVAVVGKAPHPPLSVGAPDHGQDLYVEQYGLAGAF